MDELTGQEHPQEHFEEEKFDRPNTIRAINQVMSLISVGGEEAVVDGTDIHATLEAVANATDQGLQTWVSNLWGSNSGGQVEIFERVEKCRTLCRKALG